uniref:CS domain-containing protein n=1 Tax=Arcella intermedia TaxID=1963864 RepID=A0A6B2LNI9_9EUKA|eukprot:TRINITY_DN2221_c0_g1_i1.p1 TRINITY_DN2221_c0_g1~~TRINITY_DN2221_c0_g1_i1.p1  ORF type:complete len:155 (-),score=33.20 TRINITY_DN2221_c0_g1_i1:104-568(-)
MSKPTCRWAQRKDSVFLTLDIADVKNESIDVSDTKLTFKGTSNNIPYEVVFEFFEEVTKEGSKWAVHGKSTELAIKKKTPAFWPRLTKSKAKLQWLSIDWSRWVDEDDAEDGDIDTSYMDDIGGGADIEPEDDDEEEAEHEHGPDCNHDHDHKE